MSAPEDAGTLLEHLINHWCDWDEHESYYLNVLAPGLLSGSIDGDAEETEILGKLKTLLSEKEWGSLPDLLKAKRNGMLLEVESDKRRRQAQEAERRRRALEERQRREREEKEELARKKKERETRALKVEKLIFLDKVFQEDYPNAEAIFHRECSGLLLDAEFFERRRRFVRLWLEENLGDRLSHMPDDEQLSVISHVNSHLQVIARAGSGKTTTLVLRTCFLLQHCQISPDEILILAFNKKAVKELRKRLLLFLYPAAKEMLAETVRQKRRERKGRIGSLEREIEAQSVESVINDIGANLPFVMTFHALAYAVVHPEESVLFDDRAAEAFSLSRAFQDVIDDHLRREPYRTKIRNLMLVYFREEWNRIEEGGYDLEPDELLRFRRSLPNQALRGEFVKSYGEKVIADFLFEHDLTYKYERNHNWNGINYRPDFTVFLARDSGVIIEYFGLRGDPEYDELTSQKRDYWRNKPGWRLIERFPDQVASLSKEEFWADLKEELEKNGFRCERLSEDEIWSRVRKRAVDAFSLMISSFVGRCRKLTISPSELQDRVDRFSFNSEEERTFALLGRVFYSAYLERLVNTGEDDFDGLIQKAAGIIGSGSTVFDRKSESGDLASLKYLCVDEFQDFSALFQDLLSAVMGQAPSAEVFCVGDDWQAINGFAGSDLRYFKNFEEYVGSGQERHISTNFRSHKSIVELGNSLMEGLGFPAKANTTKSGEVLFADLGDFLPSPIEEKLHGGDSFTPALLRVVGSALEAGEEVVLLSRRNAVPWYVNYESKQKDRVPDLGAFLVHIRSFFPEQVRRRITISTAHKYKGLEKQTVIVLDALERSYPLIHPSWVFFKLFGDHPATICDEERRLFYVALTRAISRLIFLTEERRVSPFLEELRVKNPFNQVQWDQLPPISTSSGQLTVRVINQPDRGTSPTYNIKDLLKASGYRWSAARGAAWERIYETESISVESLQKEAWTTNADGIEVLVCSESDTIIARYLVDGGEWYCLGEPSEAEKSQDPDEDSIPF